MPGKEGQQPALGTAVPKPSRKILTRRLTAAPGSPAAPLGLRTARHGAVSGAAAARGDWSGTPLRRGGGGFGGRPPCTGQAG